MAALAGYCVTTAVSATWVSFSFTGISGPALTFVTFVLAQAVYTARAGTGVKAAWRFAAAHRRQVLLLNVLTLASWLFMFMALQRIEASVESAVYQGSVALVGFLVAGLVAGERFSPAVRAGALAAGIALVLLIAVRLVSTADAPSANPSAGTGIALALVAGTTGGFYIFCSSRLHRDTGVSANTVLCSRASCRRCGPVLRPSGRG